MLRHLSVTAKRPASFETGRLSYRPELDGLRGLAVLGVIAFHYGLPFAQHGFLGVDVFFVLSGFLITSIIAGEWRRYGAVDWRRFYLRRAARLLPAFWLMLAVASLLVPAVSILASAGYVINWTMAFGWLPIEPAIGHTWSLAVEWQFYLIWPVLLVLGLSRWSPRTVAIVALSIGLASAGWRAIAWQLDPNWFRVFSGTDTHADGLLIGSALALMPIRLPRRLALIFAAALIVGPTLPFGFFAVIGDLLAVLATAAIISDPPRALAWRPLAFVGRISYALYLWHVPLWVWFGFVGPLPVVALTFGAALISYRYVEQPILRWRTSRREVQARIPDGVGSVVGLPLDVKLRA